MAKKSSINALLMAGISADFVAVYFRTGDIPRKANSEEVEGMPSVTKITHSRKCWGNGAAVDVPCYAVHFDGSPETILIPATQVAQVTLLTTDSADTETPNLPE